MMKIKKCLSLLVSAVMVFSAFCAGMSAFAEEGSITPITQVETTYFGGDQIDFSAYGENLLKPQYFEAAFYKDNKKTDEEPNCQTLSSINIWFNSNGEDNSLMFGGDGDSKNADNSEDQTENYWSLKFKIDGTLNNPQKFIFSSHATETLLSHHYAVFASENYSDLGNKKIIEINADTERAADKIDVSALNLTNIKYVEVRIYNRGFHSDGNYSYQHINELGFFGGQIVPESAVTAHTTKSLSEIDLKDNHLANADVVTGFYGNGEKKTGNNSDDDAELPKAADISNVLGSEIPEKDDGFFAALGAFHGSTDKCRTHGFDNSILQADSYWQMQFTLNGYLKNPEYFVFSARNDGRFTSNHYAVFASDDSSTLYNEENKIIEITADETARTADYVDLRGKTITARYIGIRFYHRGHTTSSGCSVQFLTKIGIYGGEYVESTPHTTYADRDAVVNDGKAYNDTTSCGINRLRGQNITSKFIKNGVETDEPAIDNLLSYNGNIADDCSLGLWHDANKKDECFSKDAPNGILQTDNYWQMQAELSAPIDNPEYFLVIFHEKEAYLRSKHYAVYASSSLGSLYDPSNRIIEVIDESERIGDSVDIKDKGLTDIKYIGIRFYHRGFTYDNICSIQHICEIGIYGGTLKDITGDDALFDGKTTETEISYNAEGIAWYEESFSERTINNVTLYFENTDNIPQDIGIDVKINGYWKRVAEKHGIDYGNSKSKDFQFETVAGATSVRIMASNARNNSITAFALSEIQVGNDNYKERDTVIEKPEKYDFRAAIAGDVNNDLKADAADLAILKKYLLTEQNDGFSSLDSNYDGFIDIRDLVCVKEAIK